MRFLAGCHLLSICQCLMFVLHVMFRIFFFFLYLEGKIGENMLALFFSFFESESPNSILMSFFLISKNPF